MSPEPTFWTFLADKLAGPLMKDLLYALGRPIRKKLSTPKVSKALDEAIRDALERSLESLPTPKALTGFAEQGRQHFQSLLEEFLKAEEVVDQLANLLDPRPDAVLDFAPVVAALVEQGFDPSRFPDFDLAGFLLEFARAFYSAAGSQEELQGVLQTRLLGQLLNAGERTARASEATADNTQRIADEVRELSTQVQQLLEGGSEQPLLALTQMFLGAGAMPALHGYEVFVAALEGQGLALQLDASGEVLAIGGGISDSEQELPHAQRNALQRVAKDLRQAVAGHPPSAAELGEIEQRYRQNIVRWFEHLRFQGMMRTGKPIVLPLEDVYVELRSVAEVPDAADAFGVDERRLLLELQAGGEHGDPEQYRELMGQLDALRRERWSATLPDRLSIGEALHRPDQHAFVILGDPGSGKTTLLHYLALVYARGPAAAAERFGVDGMEARRLPIFAPLAAFDDMRSKNPGLTLRQFLPLYYDARRGLPGLGPLFDRAIDSGQALVLFDGLDEVVDVQTRRLVAEQVGALIGEWTPRGVRFALSSRVVGYREAPVAGNVSTLTVLDFGAPEIEIFVRRWARAFEVWAAGGDSPEVWHLARQLEKDLMNDVRSNASVRRLAANPLMLTMLALLRRQVGRLPHRRIQLYESYVGTLLENWIEARTPGAREESLELIDRHQAENLLIPLALWLQETKPSGTAGRLEMHDRLTRICLEEEGLTQAVASRPQQRQAEQQATRFLREMRETSGLIVERGHDAFGFLHLTFQEYFAGRALAQKSDPERWRTVRPHLHDPRWREPLMLCAGRLGVVENRRPQVTRLVRSIADHEDETETDLHRNLLLALAIACDDVYLDPQLLDQLVAKAVEGLPTKVYTLGGLLIGYLVQLVANGHADLDRCLEPVWSCEDERLRRQAVSVLGRYGSVAEARKSLLARLADDPDVLHATLEALSSQVGGDEEIRNAFLDKLNDDDGDVRQAAVSALSNQLGTDEDIRNALLEKLNDKFSSVRQAAVSALSNQLGTDEEIRNALLEKLNDYLWPVRQAAVSALSNQLGTDKEIRNALLEKLNDSVSPVRQAAVSALSNQLGTDEEIRNALLEKLNDKSSSVRQAAVSALSNQLETDEEIRNALLEKLSDDGEDVRQAAVSALSNQLETDEEIRNALLEKLNDKFSSVRGAALKSLASWLLTRARALDVFGKQRRDDYWQVRQITAEVVGENCERDEHFGLIQKILREAKSREATLFLTGCLEASAPLMHAHVSIETSSLLCLEHRHWEVRQAAVSALSNQLGTDEEIRNALLEKLNDKFSSVRQAAVSALSNQLGTDEEIRNALLEKLNDKFSSVRQAAVSALSNQLGTDEDIRNALLEKLNDKDWPVRQAAVSALSNQLGTDEDIRNALLEKLNDKNFRVRQAAVSALSNQLGIDEEIRNALLEKLNDKDFRVRQAAVSALSDQLGTDEEIRNALLEKLNGDDEAVRQAAVSALSNQLGTDEEIRNALLEKLNDYLWPVRQAAVSALSNQLGTDEEIRNALLEKLNDSVSPVRQAAVSALSNQLGTDEEIRNALLEKLNDDDWTVRQAAVSALSNQLGTDEDIRNALLEKLNDDDWTVRQAAVSALSKLLGTDEDIRTVLMETLANDVFPVRLRIVEEFVDPARDSELPWAELRPWISVDGRSGSPYYLDASWPRRVQTRLAELFGACLPDDPELRKYVETLLSDVRWSSRLGAVRTLMAWPGGPPQDVVQKIVGVHDDLRGLESYPARLTAASFLINRNATSAEAVEVCLQALDYGTHLWEDLPDSRGIRKQAALVLGKLEPLRYDPAVYEKLLQVMQSDQDGDVRDAAYNALVRLARVREEAPAEGQLAGDRRT